MKIAFKIYDMEYKETIQELRQYVALLNDRINTLEEILIASSDRARDMQLLIDFYEWYNKKVGNDNYNSELYVDEYLKSINNVGSEGD